MVVDIIYTCVVVFVFRSFVCDDDDDDNGRFGEGGAGGRKKDFAIFRQSLRRATSDDGGGRPNIYLLCMPSSERTFSMKPIFFGRSAAASPPVDDMRSVPPPPLVPPTPTGRPSSRRRSRPRHRGDGDAALAACDDENDDEENDENDDDASREGGGAVAMDEKPFDVRQQPASTRTNTQVVVDTIGYLMMILLLMGPLLLMFRYLCEEYDGENYGNMNLGSDWSAEAEEENVFLKKWKGGRWMAFVDVFSLGNLLCGCGVLVWGGLTDASRPVSRFPTNTVVQRRR